MARLRAAGHDPRTPAMETYRGRAFPCHGPCSAPLAHGLPAYRSAGAGRAGKRAWARNMPPRAAMRLVQAALLCVTLDTGKAVKFSEFPSPDDVQEPDWGKNIVDVQRCLAALVPRVRQQRRQR